jgi:nifR3 family TIM-barrel protein
MDIGRLHMKNNIFLAPMAGVTDFPFRMLMREFGCGLAFTEMVSAAGLVRGMEKTDRYLDSSPDDRPLGVQLFGVDPATMAEATRVAEQRGADLVDMNMGCPVKKVVKTGAGAALMRDPERTVAILQAMRKATELPFTVKIRAGWRPNEVTALHIGRIAEDCGVDAVILHPRTADQGFGGKADWRLIAALKERLRIPVIGSGDVRRPDDAVRMFRETGCDGVMVGRGVLGNPWLIKSILHRLSGGPFLDPSLKERTEIIQHHLAMAVAYRGEKVGTRDFRKHLLWYSKGLPGGARFRAAAGKITDPASVGTALRGLFENAAEPAEAI